jgi:hypothetical protein
VLRIRDVYLGFRIRFFSSRIRILPIQIPDPGVKKAPDPGSGTLQKYFIRNKNPRKGYLARMELCPTMVSAFNDGAGITISIALLNTEASKQTINHSEIDFVTNNNQCCVLVSDQCYSDRIRNRIHRLFNKKVNFFQF